MSHQPVRLPSEPSAQQCFETYRTHQSKARAWGLTQDAAHEVGLFAVYLLGKSRAKWEAGVRANAVGAPLTEPRGEICLRCDGCGWYEGGKTLKTTCEVCSGTGVIAVPPPAGPAKWPDFKPMEATAPEPYSMLDDLKERLKGVDVMNPGGSGVAARIDADELRQLASRWKQTAIQRSAEVCTSGIPTVSEVEYTKKGGANGLYEAAVDLENLLKWRAVSAGGGTQ